MDENYSWFMEEVSNQKFYTLEDIRLDVYTILEGELGLYFKIKRMSI